VEDFFSQAGNQHSIPQHLGEKKKFVWQKKNNNNNIINK
jgi:hypothetical protein